jgi:ribonuclease HII
VAHREEGVDRRHRLNSSGRYGAEARPTQRPCVLGIDEAGRGSVVGPLVVGAFWLPEGRVEELRGQGVRDSKQLTARRREDVYRALGGVGNLRSIPLAPRTIDRWVRRGGLNDLELRAFARLIRDVAPETAIVDACDPNAERFERRLTALTGGAVRIVARHRADETDPVVGAASIVAKVRRDRALDRLRQRLGDAVGSGYPSDPVTQRFVEQIAAAPGRSPPWLRASWAPVQRVKRARPARTLDEFGP